MKHRTIVIPDGTGYAAVIACYYSPGRWTRVETLGTYFRYCDAVQGAKGFVVKERLRELNDAGK